jgi:hypothetical protein
MDQATRRTSSGFICLGFSGAHKSMQGALALVLAFSLLGNVAIAQNEDEPVRIIPRMQAVNRQAASDSGSEQQPSDAQPGQQNQPAPQSQPADSTFVLPPGTSLPVGLTRPLALKSSSAKGAGVYLQVTFPVTVGGRMAVPPGAYVQGIIETMRTNRGANPDLEFEMRSASLIFSTGYTVPLSGAVHMVHSNVRLMPSGTAPNSQPVDAYLPGPVPKPSPELSAAGTAPTLPPLPSLGNGPRNAMIAVGAVAGAAIIGFTVFAIHHRNDVYLETGTPLEIILAEPLKLDANSVTTAVQQYSAQMAIAPPEIVQPPPKMCYDPGTPGTPDTVIPGSPGTPPTVIPGANGAPDTVIPGTPATPDTVIPGTPGTPGSRYPCTR